MMKLSIVHLSRTQKQKQSLMRVILMMYLGELILRFYQTSKNLFEDIKFPVKIRDIKKA